MVTVRYDKSTAYFEDVDAIGDAQAWDRAIAGAYAPNKPVQFVFDLRRITRVPSKQSIGALSEVLERHRPTTRRLLQHSTVRVRSRWLAFAARAALVLVRPERPVRVVVG